MNDEQLFILYNQYISPPFPTYDQIVLFSKETFAIDITMQKLRSIVIEKFPDISEVKKINKKKYLMRLQEEATKEKTEKVFNETQKKIIELALEGKIQQEIGEVLNISQGYASKVIKRAGINMEEIKKTRILNRLGDISLNDLKDLFYEHGNVNGVFKWCQSLEMEISFQELIYIYEELLHLKRLCKVCGNEMDLTVKGYCSGECSKEARRDSLRTQQFNRRVKGGGKTTQSVSRNAKIKEANGICYLCKEKLDVHIKDKYHPWYIVLDHVNALIHSNDTSKKNLQAVCRCCNSIKNDKPADFYTVEEYKQNRKLKGEAYAPKTNNFDVIDQEQFIQDCLNNMTIRELCNKYNRSVFIISKMKRELGISKKIKQPSKLDAESTLLEVAILTKEGVIIRDIAKRMGIAEVTVSGYRKKAYEEGLLNQKEQKK